MNHNLIQSIKINILEITVFKILIQKQNTRIMVSRDNSVACYPKQLTIYKISSQLLKLISTRIKSTLYLLIIFPMYQANIAQCNGILPKNKFIRGCRRNNSRSFKKYLIRQRSPPKRKLLIKFMLLCKQKRELNRTISKFRVILESNGFCRMILSLIRYTI